MKSVLKVIIVSAMLVSSGCAATPKKDKMASENVQYATIMENGVKRQVRVSDESEMKTNSMSAHSAKSKDGVIVKFKDESKVDVSAFAAKYGLSFKKKLVIGYYIFLNNSSSSDTDIVQKIMENESNIKTVKPNWRVGVVPR